MSEGARPIPPVPRALSAITPRRAAVAAVAIAGAVLADAVFAIDPLFGPEQRAPAAAISRAVLVAIAGGLAASRTIQRGARAPTAAGWGAVIGVVTVVHATAVLPRDQGDPKTVLDALVFLMFAIPAAIAGALFALTALVAILPAARVEKHPPLDGLERVIVPASLWLIFVGWFARPAPCAAVMGAAALAFAAVAWRDAQRVRWLRAVSGGRVAGWSIVPDQGEPAPDPPVPLFASYDEGAIDGYLVRAETGGAAPFRAGAASERVAELPRDARAAERRLILRSLGALVLMAVSALRLWAVVK